jgi:hypothetical protein
MTRMSLDTSRLPKDALSYTDEKFFKLIRSFCGKGASDLLSIQAIRSVDSFLSIQDIYTIFELDSEDVQEIQKQCGFRKRNGTYTVKPGIKSSLDYVSNLLKAMQKRMKKTKKNQQVPTQPTDSIESTDSLSSASGLDIPANVNTIVILTISKKGESEHRSLIEKSIKDWCVKNEDLLNIADFNPISGVHYDLKFNSTFDKVEIRCSCNLSFTLLPGGLGNFKVKLFISTFSTLQDVFIESIVLRCVIRRFSAENTYCKYLLRHSGSLKLGRMDAFSL